MPRTIRFRPDGTFTIIQLTDLHWQNGDERDQKTSELIRRVLEWEDHDLVVLSGDVIEAWKCVNPIQSWRRAVEPIEQRKKLWAAVFGNHDTDDKTKVTREQLMRLQETYPRCLSKPGPAKLVKSGRVGNYLLKVRGARTRETAAVLYFVDSGEHSAQGPGVYDWITYEQIGWFRAAARRVCEGVSAAGRRSKRPTVPSVVFLHIPLPEFDEVWRTETCYGEKNEGVYGPAINSGFFASACEVGRVSGIFIGHDHENDYWGELHGVRLVYGRVGGYNTYPPPPEKTWRRGARIIRLTEGQDGFETWLRLDDGSKVTDQPKHQPTSPQSLLPAHKKP